LSTVFAVFAGVFFSLGTTHAGVGAGVVAFSVAVAELLA
jgi:hypothetical protein